MNQLTVSMYHYTRDLKHSRYPEIRGMEKQDFRAQIEFLKSEFHIVTMEQVIAAIEGAEELPPDALLLTFDDGYIDHYTYAFPILEEFGVQGSFFIPGKTFSTHQLLDVNKIHYMLASANITELVEDVKKLMDRYRGVEFDYPPTEDLYAEYAVPNRFDSGDVIFVKRILQTVLPEIVRNRISSDLFEKYVGLSEEKLAYELYMTEDQIRTLKRHGMFIGIHGYDHYWLGNLPKEQMERDISMALETLDAFIDQKKWVMNYPYGNYNDDVIRYIKKRGACAGFTTQVRVAEIGRDSAFEIPRLDCNDFPPKSDKYKGFYA